MSCFLERGHRVWAVLSERCFGRQGPPRKTFLCWRSPAGVLLPYSPCVNLSGWKGLRTGLPNSERTSEHHDAAPPLRAATPPLCAASYKINGAHPATRPPYRCRETALRACPSRFPEGHCPAPFVILTMHCSAGRPPNGQAFSAGALCSRN